MCPRSALYQTGDHVENRSFACAIWTKQADRFTAPHVERHTPHHHAAAETFLHTMRGKIGRARSLPPVAGAPLLRGARRLLAAIRPLQWSRLRIHGRLLLRARFGPETREPGDCGPDGARAATGDLPARGA